MIEKVELPRKLSNANRLAIDSFHTRLSVAFWIFAISAMACFLVLVALFFRLVFIDLE